MLVEVFILRREGVKRARAEVMRSEPLMRQLVIEPNGAELAATLRPLSRYDGTPTLFLYGCQVTRVTEAGMLVVGYELGGKVWEQTRVRQAWWCRLVERESAAA